MDRDGSPVPLVLGRRVRGLSYCRAEITARLRSLCSLLLLALASLGNGSLAGRLWLAGNAIFVAVRLSLAITSARRFAMLFLLLCCVGN